MEERRMKRIMTVMASLLLVAALAVPAFSWGPRGGGRDSRDNMRGGYYGPGQYSRGYEALTEEQRAKLADLDKKYFDETNKTRNDLIAKSAELDTVLGKADPDAAKAKELQNEISGLRSVLGEKRMEYQLEVRKIVPDAQYGRGYGRGYGAGRGYGRHMDRGFGPGACWN
jgi:zinc resistance-associated protein